MAERGFGRVINVASVMARTGAAYALTFNGSSFTGGLTVETLGASNDLIIAATALANGLTLVTHNTREFGRVEGLLIEDWEK